MFSARSLQPELLDSDAIPTNDLYQNLKELNTINTLLGGYRMAIRLNTLKSGVLKTISI
jgi:hypothetical protein